MAALKVLLKLLVRLPLSLVFGWFSLLVPMWIVDFFGLGNPSAITGNPLFWGFTRSEWVSLLLPIGIGVGFWLFGFVPILRFRGPSPARPSLH